MSNCSPSPLCLSLTLSRSHSLRVSLSLTRTYRPLSHSRLGLSPLSIRLASRSLVNRPSLTHTCPLCLSLTSHSSHSDSRDAPVLSHCPSTPPLSHSLSLCMTLPPPHPALSPTTTPYLGMRHFASEWVQRPQVDLTHTSRGNEVVPRVSSLNVCV